MNCSKCGIKLIDGAKFCPNCGTPVSDFGNQSYQPPIVDDDDEKTMSLDAYTNSEINISQNTEDNEAGSSFSDDSANQVKDNNPINKKDDASYSNSRNVFSGNNTVYVTSKPMTNGSLSFGEAIRLFFENYVNFTGRATKSEYWWGFLFTLLMSLTVIGAFVCYIGMLSLTIRRLHDIGKPWPWVLMGLIPYAGVIILIVYYCRDSDGDNRWGPSKIKSNATTINNQFQYNQTQNINLQQNNKVSENDIIQMAKNHEPMNLNMPTSKVILDSNLRKIIPTYSGAENLATAMMTCDPQEIKKRIQDTDTDSLLIIYKAFDYYMSIGMNRNVLGMVQQNVLLTLKNRF